MKKFLLAMALVLLAVFPVMAQTGTTWVRADSAQTTDYITYVPYVAGGACRTGKIELTIYMNGGELKTWGYSVVPNNNSNIGQQYDGQLFDLVDQSAIQAQWIHYFYLTRDMTDIVNSRELQAKLLGWAYFDRNNSYKDPSTYQPLGVPPVLYEGNINDLYGQANAWGGAIFIYSKGPWTFPPRFVNAIGRLERRENPTIAPVMRLSFQAVNGDGSQITTDQVESVEWIGKGTGTPYMIDTILSMPVSYNTTKRFWNPPQMVQPFTELQYHWADMPTNLGPATFRITLKDGNVLPDLNTNIKSLNDLPVIPAIFTRDTYDIIKDKDKKSGKIVVKAELIQETVNNITVREIPDPIGCNPDSESCGTALVIQWPEPDIALLGGLDMPPDLCGPNNPCAQYQVKVMVGVMSPWPPVTNGVMKECNLWYDVPAQMGTVVVDTDSYTLLKNELVSRGFDLGSLGVAIIYREYYLMPPGSPSIPIPYINRAHSSLVHINTFE